MSRVLVSLALCKSLHQLSLLIPVSIKSHCDKKYASLTDLLLFSQTSRYTHVGDSQTKIGSATLRKTKFPVNNLVIECKVNHKN